jgi:hypothetical protein
MPAIGNRSHAHSLPRTPPIQQPVFLTMPPWPLMTLSGRRGPTQGLHLRRSWRSERRSHPNTPRAPNNAEELERPFRPAYSERCRPLPASACRRGWGSSSGSAYRAAKSRTPLPSRVRRVRCHVDLGVAKSRMPLLPKLTNAAEPFEKGAPSSVPTQRPIVKPEMTTFVPDRTKSQYLCPPAQLTTYRREARDGAIQSPALAGGGASPLVWPSVC